MAAPSRVINDKLDKFDPLVCCDEYVKKGYNPYQTTYQTEYPDSAQLRDVHSDISSRLRYMLRDQGLHPAKFLTEHHNHNSSERSYNTQYTEDYNKLPRRNILPPTRYFYVHKGEHGVWEPEKSDHPMIGHPWNYGYADKKRVQWKKEQDDLDSRLCFQDQYWPESWKYSRYGNQEYKEVHRYATPKQHSSKLFDPKLKLGCRGESRLYQPNEVHNSADTVARDKMDRVELSRRIYQTPDVYPVTEYPGDTQLMHRENRPLHTI